MVHHLHEKKLKEFSVNKNNQWKLFQWETCLQTEILTKKWVVLNMHKLNLYEILNIMFRVKDNSIQEALQTKFKFIEDNYSARHGE